MNEVDAIKVNKGNRAFMTFDAISNLKIKGLVTDVDLVGTISQGVVTYNIKITFEDKDERIRPGMSVDASIVTEEKPDILIVPSSAIKSQGKKYYVEVFDTEQDSISTKSSPQKVFVDIGDSDDVNTEIISGVSAGRKIVMRTISSTNTSTSTTAPSIFGNIGGNQRSLQRNLQGGNRTAGTNTK